MCFCLHALALIFFFLMYERLYIWSFTYVAYVPIICCNMYVCMFKYSVPAYIVNPHVCILMHASYNQLNMLVTDRKINIQGVPKMYARFLFSCYSYLLVIVCSQLFSACKLSFSPVFFNLVSLTHSPPPTFRSLRKNWVVGGTRTGSGLAQLTNKS